MRAFVAIELHEELRRSLHEASRRLEAAGPAAKLVSQDNLHLTLKFLGHIRPEDLVEATSILGAVAASIDAFDMRVFGMGLLPKRGRPRIVYAGVDAPPMLTALASGIDSAFERMSIPSEGRPFHPHVTIARLRARKKNSRGNRDGGLDTRTLRALVARQENRSFGTQEVGEVVLFESVLSPGGPSYTALSRARLRR